MKHNARRALSMIMALLMCLNLFTGIVLPASAAETTPAAPPDGTIFVNLGWTESDTPASITVNGKTFALTWGTNAFATAQSGLDAAPAGGTVYLCAGTYGGFNIKKNLTVLGAKYGVDPNVRYADELKPWTLNTNRGGSDETVITGNVHFGISGNTMYHDATDMTLDGVKVTGAGQLRAHNAKVNNNGMVKVAVKNIYLKDSTVTNGSPLCFRPFYGLNSTTGVTSNACQRDITIENLRIEGQDAYTTDNNNNKKYTPAMELIADKTDISGVYMHTDCLGIFLSGPAASANSTDEVTFRLADSMFCNPVYRTIYLNWQTGSATYSKVPVNANIGNRSKVSTTVENCVFLDAHKNSGTLEFCLAFATNTENTYFTFKNNTFVTTTAPTVTSYAPLAGHTEDTTKKYGSKITVKNNKFIGCNNVDWSFGGAGEPVDVSGNYSENANGEVSPLTTGGPVTQDWYWWNRAMTKRSDQDRKPLPRGTLFVDLNWTESTVPQTISVDDTDYDLTWGTTAFSDVQTALDTAPAGGTVYLCAGTYSTNVYIKKNLTLVGVKYGIDPNVKGKNQKDLWTLNADRGTGETIFTARIYIGVNGNSAYAAATDMTVDGIMLSGAGQLLSNCGAAGSAKMTLKNLYMKGSTTTPLYLFPYWPNGHQNKYKRNVVIENVRVEACSTGVMNLTADAADVSGVYMHTDCKGAFLNTASASSGPTDAVEWNIHDCMFATPVARVIYLDWQNPASNKYTLSTGLENRSKVTTKVYDNVFVNSFVTSGSNSAYTLAFRPHTENLYLEFVGNTFYHDTAPASGHTAIAGYASVQLEYGNQITVKNNAFIGKFAGCYGFNQTKSAVDISGNYYENDQGKVLSLPVSSTTVKQDWWWLDRAMTERSDTPIDVSDPAQWVDIEEDLKWLGRTYVEDEIHYFNWTNSGFEININGTGLSAEFASNSPASNQTYLKVYVDGEYTKTIQLESARTRIILAENLSDGEHTIRVMKRTNGRSSTAGLVKLWVDEGTEILKPNKEAGRKIQFLGDSITVGYGSMDWLSPSAWSTDSEDGTITYAALTSKYFGADNHTIAVSGRGVIWNTGGNKDTANHAPLMYEYTDWNNHDQWDHSNYQPDVVVINLGTNDRGNITGAEDQETFKTAAYNLIAQVREANPDAYIIWAYGAMGDSNNVEGCIQAMVERHNSEGDSKVSYLHLNSGTTCLGHPTSAAHEDRAEELIAKIEEVTGWDEHTVCDYDVKATTEPTCVQDGYGAYTCKVCGDYYEGVIPATGKHSFTVEQSKTPATCVATGSVTMKCDKCDATETKTLAIDPAAHTGKNTTEGAMAGDCGNAGHTGKTVCECGATIDEGKEIPATGAHTEGEQVTVTEPTVSTDGLATVSCSKCGALIREIVLPKTGVASIGDESFATFAEAIAAAKAGDTIQLYADVEVEYLALDPAVKLDLNGKQLKADYFIGFKGSAVYGGKLIAPQNKVALDMENGGYLPVFDGEGYIFITVGLKEAKAVDAESGETYYYFSPDLSAAHDALYVGAEASGVKVVVRLSWTKEGNYTAEQSFIYMDKFVQEVIESYGEKVEYPDYYTKMFTASFAGSEADTAEDLMISAVLVSDTGVEIASAGVSFAK